MQAFDDDLEDVAGCVDDFVDVVAVVGIPLDECAEGDGAAVVACCDAVGQAVGLDMRLDGSVVRAAFHDGL